jgi:protein TonB
VDEAVEKQGAKWIKWILIAAGPAVLALVLLIVFSRSSTSSSATAEAKTPPAPAAATTNEPPAVPGSQLIVNATGKSTPSATSALAKSSPSPQANVSAEESSTPVSPDAMAQQLVAPSRIAGAIKAAPPSDEAPPAAPAPVAFDDNNAIPGSIFNSGNKAKVAPHSVNISAGIAEGMIIRKTPPLYPRFAQEAHIAGKVVLKATITKQGTIEGVQVLSGPKILAPAAVDAVKTWKYRPYMLDNQPVAVETNITIVFGGLGN